MHIIDRGRGETVVLLHGANPVSYFDDLVEALAPHYRVLVPELPGWGKSPALVEGQAFEVTNDALRETLRQAGVDRAAIVGYSLGGWRALELALSGVFDVTCVYLLSSFTASPAPELRERYRGYAELARSKADLRPAVRDLYLPPEYAAAHPDIHDQVTDWVHACPRDVFAGELAAVADITDLAPQLSSLTKPVVARVGALDIAAPADWSRAIVDAVPQGRLELVEGCGHALLYEDRDATITSILKYLSQCTGRDARRVTTSNGSARCAHGLPTTHGSPSEQAVRCTAWKARSTGFAISMFFGPASIFFQPDSRPGCSPGDTTGDRRSSAESSGSTAIP